MCWMDGEAFLNDLTKPSIENDLLSTFFFYVWNKTRPGRELIWMQVRFGDNSHQPMQHFVQNTHSLSFYGGTIALKHFVLRHSQMSPAQTFDFPCQWKSSTCVVQSNKLRAQRRCHLASPVYWAWILIQRVRNESQWCLAKRKPFASKRQIWSEACLCSSAW